MEHEQAQIAEGAAALGVSLPSDIVERLAEYAELLRTLGSEVGVIGPGEGDKVVERHILDCLRAAPHVRGPRCLDLGSGGGLPSLVLALALPAVQVTAVDRRRRKVGFVELAADRLDVTNLTCVLGDVDSISDLAETVTARAFAPADVSWRCAAPHLVDGGRLLYFGGKGFRPSDVSVAGVSCETVANDTLEGSGPLAIMSRG